MITTKNSTRIGDLFVSAPFESNGGLIYFGLWDEPGTAELNLDQMKEFRKRLTSILINGKESIVDFDLIGNVFVSIPVDDSDNYVNIGLWDEPGMAQVEMNEIKDLRKLLTDIIIQLTDKQHE